MPLLLDFLKDLIGDDSSDNPFLTENHPKNNDNHPNNNKDIGFLSFPKDLVSSIKNWITNIRLFKDNAAITDDDRVATDAFGVTNSTDGLDNISLLEALENMITGNYDFARNAELQNQALQFNAQEAQKARDFQLEMSNTAYKRMVEDLESAGLNPAVALGGSGASTGYAVSASGSSNYEAPHNAMANFLGNLTQLLGSALHSAVATNNLDKQLEASGVYKENQLLKSFLKKKNNYSFQSNTSKKYDTDEAVKLFKKLYG